MRFKKTLSAALAAAMLSTVFCTAGAVSASAAEAASVDGIDPADFSSYTTYDGELGALYTPEATTFKVWAPTSSDVKLRLYTTGSDKEDGAKLISETQMELDKKTGVWSVRVEGDQKNVYYTYFVTNDMNPKGGEVVDIYAKAAGVNGNRGMVVDLDSTDPAGWDNDTYKLVDSPTQAQVWEVHVKDFSYDPESGVSDQYRGKYMAFTELETTLNNAGDVKTCMNYLKDLGINYVQINPMYDFASVNEASGDDTQFNWGYDPKNYNVPEGSYSTNPYDGNVRITEIKTMIETLHANGIGVIMDVVYNHTYESKTSWFNLTVPDYYYRIKEDGNWSNGSGCGNDTASERTMFAKFMVDSVTYWAEEYHIDGFRFDLMGLHDCDTMEAVRESLDKIDTRILMYGEGWVLGSTNDKINWAGNKSTLCTQAKASRISDRIGFFNDDVRDSLKGKAFDDLTTPGFVAGVTGNAGNIYKSMIGHFTTGNWRTAAPGQNVVYSCCHDNQTLWDRLVASEFGATASKEQYAARNEAFVASNKLSGAIEMTSQGIPFILAGEEFSRTKYGDHNSYKSSPEINMLDWSRVSDYADVVSYYKGLIALRNAFPGFSDSTQATGEAIEELDAPSGIIALNVPNIVDKSGNTWSNLLGYFNGSRTKTATVLLPGAVINKGDVNADGKITSSDALSILRHSANAQTLPDAVVGAADLNGDEKITSADALTVLRISVGIEKAPASEGGKSTEYSVLADDQTAGLSEIKVVSGAVTLPVCSALILVPKSEYDRVDVGAKTDENEGTVIVSHVNKDTGETFFKTTIRGTEGQGYTTYAAGDLALEYDLDHVEGNASGKITKGTTEVKYFYTLYPGGVGTVEVKYLDEKGKALDYGYTFKARAGEDYTSEAREFPWYKLVSMPDNANGKFVKGKTDVIYNYEPSDEIDEATIHVFMNGGNFKPTLYMWGLYNPDNESHEYTVAEWPGFAMEDSDGDGWYDYTFKYGSAYRWILNEEGGTQTANLVNSGDIWVIVNGTVSNMEILDYNPEEGKNPGEDVKKGTLIVKHVDENGKEISTNETKRPEGTEYKAEPLESEWYALDETKLPANAEGKYTDGTTEVVFYYKIAKEFSEKTIHVKLADDADFEPYLYFWEAKTAEVKWPGTLMKDEDKDGWYELTIEAGESYNWIINDGNGNQTKDMTAEGDIWVIATSPSVVTVHDTNPDL